MARLPSLLAMRAFEAAARHRSVKKAAEELGVTPSAISQQIRRLEEELDLDLLARGSRRMAITEAGQALQQDFQRAFGQLQAAVDRASEPGPANVTIGTNPSFSTKCIVPPMPAFVAEHPELNLSLNLERNFRRLLQAPVDIFIIFLDGPSRRLQSEVLCEEKLIPLASPAFLARHPIRAPADLATAPLIADDSMASFDIDVPDWESWFEAAGVTERPAAPRMSFDTNASHAIDAAICGSGVLLGRRTLAHNDVCAGRLVEIFEPALPMPCAYYLMAEATRLEDPNVRKVWDWLKRGLFDN